MGVKLIGCSRRETDQPLARTSKLGQGRICRNQITARLGSIAGLRLQHVSWGHKSSPDNWEVRPGPCGLCTGSFSFIGSLSEMQDSSCPRPAGPGSAPHKPQDPPGNRSAHCAEVPGETGSVATTPPPSQPYHIPFPRVQLPTNSSQSHPSLNVCFRRPHLRQGLRARDYLPQRP